MSSSSPEKVTKLKADILKKPATKKYFRPFAKD
jgi:hypothetical protein